MVLLSIHNIRFDLEIRKIYLIRPNKNISAVRVTGLKISGRIGTFFSGKK